MSLRKPPQLTPALPAAARRSARHSAGSSPTGELLAPPVIPAKAGIQSDDTTFSELCGDIVEKIVPSSISTPHSAKCLMLTSRSLPIEAGAKKVAFLILK